MIVPGSQHFQVPEIESGAVAPPGDALGGISICIAPLPLPSTLTLPDAPCTGHRIPGRRWSPGIAVRGQR